MPAKLNKNIKGFPKPIINKAIKALDLKSNTKRSGGKSVHQEISERLNLVKTLDQYATKKSNIPPKKFLKYVEDRQDYLQEILTLLNNLNNENLPDLGDFKLSAEDFLLKEKLLVASKYNPEASSGLLGWDNHPFNHKLLNAIAALEKINSYFEIVVKDAKKAVKGRGEKKPDNSRPDFIIFMLCIIYKDFTGRAPKTYVNDIDDKVIGDAIPFLKIILPHTSFPFEMSDYALESRLRKIRKINNYSHLWGK